jgi:uncharacterized protein YbjT (DUF2867 family)
MATRRVATVFGGSGFIGRYIVKRLAASGYVVRVVGRDPESALFLKPMGAVGQIVPLFASPREPATIARATVDANVVVNCVGILAEPAPGEFMRIQAEGAGQMARACAEAGVERLVHLSAIGADPASESLYARSKGEGERAVMAAFPAATILRPSVVFGREDQFFNRFAGIARFSPVVPVISGDSRFQPVFVGDVADAVMGALAREESRGRIYELGGPRVYTFRELIQWIVKTVQRRRFVVDVPPDIARLQARVMEHLPGKPLTRDQLLLLSKDNVASPDFPGLADLGVSPTPVELVVPSYLARFRPGGGHRDRYMPTMDANRP